MASKDRPDEEARRQDRMGLAERARLDRGTVWRLAGAAVLWALCFVGACAIALERLPAGSGEAFGLVLPLVAVLAFALEALDAAAGMGFGTGLAAILFAMGYDPLQVVPALLVGQAVTGIVASALHHEFENVKLSFRPLNETTRVVLLATAFGVAGTVLAAVLVHRVLSVPDWAFKSYVAALVVAMGAAGLLRSRLRRREHYRPRRLLSFAALAGANKSIGGGGFGPVMSIGAILSGVHAKAAPALTTQAEALTSLVAVGTFFVLQATGLTLEFELLPSLVLGGFAAAVAAPYAVRLLPGHVLDVAIPVYAIVVAVTSLAAYLTR